MRSVSAEPSAFVVGAFHVSDTDAASALAVVMITPTRESAAMIMLEPDLAARRVGDFRSAPPVIVMGSPRYARRFVTRSRRLTHGKRGARPRALQDCEKQGLTEVVRDRVASER